MLLINQSKLKKNISETEISIEQTYTNAFEWFTDLHCIGYEAGEDASELWNLVNVIRLLSVKKWVLKVKNKSKKILPQYKNWLEKII